MRKIFIVLMMFMPACKNNLMEVGIAKDGVIQRVDQNCEMLTPSGKALVTRVWYKRDIVKSWYDDLETITDSIVLLRQRQGDSLLHILKDTR